MVAKVVNPRIQSVPTQQKRKGGLGEKAAELFAEAAGYELDDWQRLPLDASLGDPMPLKVAVNVPRQNGKGEIILARMLAGVFLLEEPLQIYTAHLFKTAMEMFRRFEWLIDDTRFAREIKRNQRGQPAISHSHGTEGIEFTGNRRVQFQTRTRSGGRGMTCDTPYLDEAMYISEAEHQALEYTISARPRSQILYFGSAVDQEIHDNGVVFARLRERAQKGDDPTLAYFEWSAPVDHPHQVTEHMAADRAVWKQANPAAGDRIRWEIIEEEARGSARAFAVERLGAGDWPRTDHVSDSPVSLEQWVKLADPESQIVEGLVFAFDVSPDRKCAIAAAGRNMQGLYHVEIVDSKQGTKWLPERIAGLAAEHQPEAVVADGYGPSASMIGQVHEHDLEVRALDAREHASACGRLVDLVAERQLVHTGQPQLVGALRGAKSRPLGDAWAWSRRNSDVDISPLVAATLALGVAVEADERSVYEQRGMIAV